MSFGKRQFIRDPSALPFDLRTDLSQVFILAGLWVAGLDLRGGRAAQDQKRLVLRDRLTRNIHKFEHRPFISAVLRTARDSPWPLPLPGDVVRARARMAFEALGDYADPLDVQALRLAFMDMTEAVARVGTAPFAQTTPDPFFNPIPWRAKILRGITRLMVMPASVPEDPADLPGVFQEALGSLAEAVRATALWSVAPHFQDPEKKATQSAGA